VRQCAQCGRRELSRQWESREQALDGGGLRGRLFQTQWQCERCGSPSFELVEYKGPRWMQWE
jgi:ribosomal protein L37E